MKGVFKEFDLTDLEYARFRRMLEVKPSFKNFLRKNKTDAFLREMNKIKKDKRNLLAEVVGETGTGKSYSSIALALRNDSEFSADKIFFTQRDLIEKARDVYAGKPITLINDEQTKIIGIGTYRILSQYNDFLETIRKKQISIVRNSPTRKHYVNMNLSHYLLQTFSGFIDEKRGILRAALCDNLFYCLGFVEFSNPVVAAPDLIKKYEKKKDKFLDEMLHDGSESTFLRDAEKLLNSSEFRQFADNNKKLSREDLFNFVDFMRPELKRGNEAVEVLSSLIFKIKMSEYAYKLFGVKPKT